MGPWVSLLLSSSALAAPQVELLKNGGVLIRPGGAVLPAQTLLEPPPLPVSTADPISLDLQDADIHSVLRLISATAEINIVASDDVQGRVTVRLEDVPWDQALTVILLSHGLVATAYGENILLVEPLAATLPR